jgi:hypothetical protein
LSSTRNNLKSNTVQLKLSCIVLIFWQIKRTLNSKVFFLCEKSPATLVQLLLRTSKKPYFLPSTIVNRSLQSHRVLSKATRAPPPHCSEIRFPDLRSSSSPGSGIATSSVIQFRRKRNSIVRCSVTPSARYVCL